MTSETKAVPNHNCSFVGVSSTRTSVGIPWHYVINQFLWCHCFTASADTQSYRSGLIQRHQVNATLLSSIVLANLVVSWSNMLIFCISHENNTATHRESTTALINRKAEEQYKYWNDNPILGNSSNSVYD